MTVSFLLDFKSLYYTVHVSKTIQFSRFLFIQRHHNVSNSPAAEM